MDREQLIKKVASGELLPGEAEECAKKEGLGSLANLDGGGLNPMDQSSWTLAMAVAWIADRSLTSVADAWNEYRTNCRQWVELHPKRQSRLHDRVERRIDGRGQRQVSDLWDEIDDIDDIDEIDGYEIWALRAPKLVTLSNLGSRRLRVLERSQALSFDAAKSDLWSRLSDGTIVADAISLTTESVVEIPNVEWSRLESVGLDGDGNEMFGFFSDDERYSQVHVQRETVLATWHPVITRSNGRPSPRANEIVQIMVLLERQGKNLRGASVSFIRNTIEDHIKSNSKKYHFISVNPGTLRKALKLHRSMYEELRLND